ncbi:hypothetical protein P8452_54836 [Trifolium repens]|nr:hypothetical protein P8452_54836 [Trifolium repens]
MSAEINIPSEEAKQFQDMTISQKILGSNGKLYTDFPRTKISLGGDITFQVHTMIALSPIQVRKGCVHVKILDSFER